MELVEELDTISAGGNFKNLTGKKRKKEGK